MVTVSGLTTLNCHLVDLFLYLLRPTHFCAFFSLIYCFDIFRYGDFERDLMIHLRRIFSQIKMIKSIVLLKKKLRQVTSKTVFVSNTFELLTQFKISHLLSLSSLDQTTNVQEIHYFTRHNFRTHSHHLT